jgi:hypothetical protein
MGLSPNLVIKVTIDYRRLAANMITYVLSGIQL